MGMIHEEKSNILFKFIESLSQVSSSPGEELSRRQKLKRPRTEAC